MVVSISSHKGLQIGALPQGGAPPAGYQGQTR